MRGGGVTGQRGDRAGLSHIDRAGRVRMVDVGDRDVSDRQATASGFVQLSPDACRAIADGEVTKGDVLEICRVAGIMAAKRTHDLIPLCHPISISHISVDADVDRATHRVLLRATVRCRDATGVEMEALTAVAVAGLTVIDMVKSLDPWAEVGGIRMESKSGGRSGTVRHPRGSTEGAG